MASIELRGAARAAAQAGSDRSRLDIDRLVIVVALAVLVIAALSFTGAMVLAQVGLDRHDMIAGDEDVSMTAKFLVKFDLGGELTVAAWLSSVLMLACAGVLWHIAQLRRAVGDPYTRHWAVLGLIFVGLSIDEMVAFHEMTINPLRAALNGSGVFLYTWVVLGIGFVAVVGLAYLRFVFRQSAWLRNRIILAGALFVTGALGFEMMEGAFAEFYGQHRLINELAIHAEELLEFAGLLVFLHALLGYVRAEARVLLVRLE